MYQNYKETKEKSGGKSFRYKFDTFGHWWSWNSYTKFFILQRQIRHSRIFYFIFCYYVQSIPKPPIPPGHLTRVKLRTVGNLTQNEARPVGHLIFVSKRLSAVGNKTISQFFDSALAPHSRVIALVDSTWVFLLLSFLYRGICLCLKCGAKTSWTRNS